MIRTPREAETHRLIAGDAALDFANTLNGHERPRGHEYLHDFRDLALWCRHAGLLSDGEERRIQAYAARRPARAGALFRTSIALREAIFRVFRALALGGEPALEDINLLNAIWQEGQRHARVRRARPGYALAWDDSALLEQIPRKISSAAVSALLSDSIARVKACSGQGCDWLFLDNSRNHLRRWCSMDECGNRAKMRRRQERKRQAATGRMARGRARGRRERRG